MTERVAKSIATVDAEITRLLLRLEVRLNLESLAAASACIEDLAGVLQGIADAGKPFTSAIARRALRAYAEP